MGRPEFDPKELEKTGERYPVVPSPKFNTANIIDPVLNTPISPRENLKLLLSGKKPYWIPKWGLFNSDIHEIRPRINPDNRANRQFFDGGERPDYANMPLVQKGWFGLEWEYVTEAGGATVHPGNPLVTDINNWRSQIEIPYLDEIDWDAFKEENKEYMSSNKFHILGISCSLWERLMALMDVEQACVALVDDEQQDGVKDFFDWYSDFEIDYIRRVADCFPELDGVLLHEDWAHQRGPFFSPDTAREMIAPYTKKIIDYCHSRGLSYEIHCCGDCKQLIPVFIEMGADMWGGQETANDFATLAKQYKNEKFVFCVSAPILPKDADDSVYDEAARKWVDEFKDCHICLRMIDLGTGVPAHPKFVEGVYKYSRIEFSKE